MASSVAKTVAFGSISIDPILGLVTGIGQGKLDSGLTFWNCFLLTTVKLGVDRVAGCKHLWVVDRMTG